MLQAIPAHLQHCRDVTGVERDIVISVSECLSVGVWTRTYLENHTFKLIRNVLCLLPVDAAPFSSRAVAIYVMHFRFCG